MANKHRTNTPRPNPKSEDGRLARADVALIDAAAASARVHELRAELEAAAGRRAVLIADARQRWSRHVVAEVLGISEWQVTDAERKASGHGQTRNERAVAATARRAADRRAEAAKKSDKA